MFMSQYCSLIVEDNQDEKYEEMVREYNQKRSEYESLGDEQFALEQKLKEGKRIIENCAKIEAVRDGEKEKLSELYRDLGVKMEVSMKDVAVDFGAGVKEKVGIEKKDKSWRAK